MTASRRRLHYLQLRNRALVGLTSSAAVLFALGQIGPVTGPINTALFTVLGVGAKFGLLLGVVTVSLAQIRSAIAPPSRSSRRSTASADTGKSEDAADAERRPGTTTEDDPVERAHQRYVVGEIGDLELETELEDALIERASEQGK